MTVMHYLSWSLSASPPFLSLALRLLTIELLPHPHARLQDPGLAVFLNHIRTTMPYLLLLETFFGDRLLPHPRNLQAFLSALAHVESSAAKVSTVLTVSNAAAAHINAKRVEALLPDLAALPRLPADPRAGGGFLTFAKHVRLRVTRNLDKERGLVNGTIGVAPSLGPLPLQHADPSSCQVESVFLSCGLSCS